MNRLIPENSWYDICFTWHFSDSNSVIVSDRRCTNRRLYKQNIIPLFWCNMRTPKRVIVQLSEIYCIIFRITEQLRKGQHGRRPRRPHPERSHLGRQRRAELEETGVGRVIRHLWKKNLLKGWPTLEHYFYYVDWWLNFSFWPFCWT